MADTTPKQGDILATGKAKSVYLTEDKERLILHFRDDTSAFDGEKMEQLSDKGRVNNQFNAFIMDHLNQNGIPTHFVKTTTPRDSLVKRLEMMPVEFVVRNIATGSLCKRYGIENGLELSPPLLELFYKDDERHDPMITEEHAKAFGWADENQLREGKALSLKVNTLLKDLFDKAGILLVDYKLEFGSFHGDIVLGDEFTPDGCRLWDKKTRESLDKDRFRKDLGDVVESYKLVAQRLGIKIN